ncbi:MAG: hypothetical protein H0T73_06795 [Ardenticatenales bacterium]|nr:hypothetical protein [Ardenticatenales bacterium]
MARQYATREDEIRSLSRELRHNWRSVRRDAATRLGELQAIEAVDALVACLMEFDPEDEESRANMSAGAALSELGEVALQTLLERLFDADTQFSKPRWSRSWIVETIAIFEDPRAVEPLQRAADQWPYLRREVRLAVERIHAPSSVGGVDEEQ